jgi:hypothetical protein
MKKIISIILLSIFTITNTIFAQNQSIYANGGESSVNWDEIMSEYESPDYNDAPFWNACIEATSNVRASSTLSPQGKYNYSSVNLHDYDPRTPWVEGKDDYGIGEYLDLDLPYSSGENIYIFNGYQKSYSSWKNNSRVKKLRVYANKKPICYIELKDKMGGQYFNLPENNYQRVRFVIVDVYKGDKWKDVAISEIHQRGCCFNSNTKILNFKNTLSIDKIQKGNDISYLDLKTDKIKVSKVIQSAKQIHHTLLKISTKDHAVELTQSHPLYIKDHGFTSLYVLKRDNNFINYQEMLGKIEILVWNNEKQKSEYQKLIQIEKINGEFETHTILKLEQGKTYIANGFVTSVY